MIKALLSIIAALLGAAAIVWFAAFLGMSSEAKTQKIDGKILKDVDGNFYKIEQHLGNTFTIEVITSEEIF